MAPPHRENNDPATVSPAPSKTRPSDTPSPEASAENAEPKTRELDPNTRAQDNTQSTKKLAHETETSEILGATRTPGVPEEEPTVPVARGAASKNTATEELLSRPALPFASGLRSTLAVLLAVLAIFLAATGAAGKWVESNLVDPRGFNNISEQLVDDTDLQKRIASAAVHDLMHSDRGKKYFEETGNNFFTSVLANNREQVEQKLGKAAEEVATTGEYKKLWRQISTDTHAHLMNDEDTPAAIDVSAFYRELDAKVGSFGIHDPDIAAWGNRYIPLEDAQHKSIHRKVIRLKMFSQSADKFLIGALVCLLGALMLWPRSRLFFATAVFVVVTLACWGASVYAEASSAASMGLHPSGEIGTVFLNGFLDKVRPSVVADLRAVASYSAIVAFIMLLMGILGRLYRLTASTTTVATR